MTDWSPRPEDISETLIWWGCCEETGGSPAIKAAHPADPRDEWIRCPHCGEDVTEEKEDARSLEKGGGSGG